MLWGSFEDCWIWHCGRTMGLGRSPSLPNPCSAPLPWMPLLWANHTWGRSHNSPLPTSALALVPGHYSFMLSSISSLMWISSLKICHSPRCSNHIELTHTPSRGLPAPQYPAQLSDLHPLPPPPSQGKWGRVPGQKVLGKQQTLSLFLSCCSGFQYLLCSGRCTYIVSNPHNPPTGGILLMGSSMCTKIQTISQAVSASGFELGSCWHQNPVFPKQASLTFQVEVRHWTLKAGGFFRLGGRERSSTFISKATTSHLSFLWPVTSL